MTQVSLKKAKVDLIFCNFHNFSRSHFECCVICAKLADRNIPESDFGQVIPDMDEYTKEPPALPPHLRHIILNKVSAIS